MPVMKYDNALSEFRLLIVNAIYIAENNVMAVSMQ